jgi:hypothetical protein
MIKYKKCEICGFDFPYNTGKFTTHLMEDHNLLLKDYIIQYELSGLTPKCVCGYCDEDAPFFRGKFLERIGKHQKYQWLKEQYIIKNDMPKCIKCGNDVKWNRGKPNKYCSFKCLPSNWNQEKINTTVKEKYGVDNVSFLDEIKNKISNSNKYTYLINKECINIKYKKTCMNKYGVEHTRCLSDIQEKFKISCLKSIGVDHPSKTIKFRNNASLRMIKNNSEFDFTNCYKIRKYKDTNLCYQSLYEYHFLEHCEKNNILGRVKNGNVYNFLPNESSCGFRTLTDFCIDDIEIEIKSTYILEKQGGQDIIDIKRSAVERASKQYLLILDKHYEEFDKVIK